MEIERMDYDEKYDEKGTRVSMSDKIRRFGAPREKKVREVCEVREYGWSLSEAMDIGSSILALMEERALATSQVD